MNKKKIYINILLCMDGLNIFDTTMKVLFHQSMIVM